jgi:hypothetical protein
MQLHILLTDAVVHPLQTLKRGHDAGFGEFGHFDLSLVHYRVACISPELAMVFHHQVDDGGDQMAEGGDFFIRHWCFERRKGPTN